jgi:hypothetical protein
VNSPKHTLVNLYYGGWPILKKDGHDTQGTQGCQSASPDSKAKLENILKLNTSPQAARYIFVPKIYCVANHWEFNPR